MTTSSFSRHLVHGSIGLLVLLGASCPSSSTLKPAEAFVVHAPIQSTRRYGPRPTFLEHDQDTVASKAIFSYPRSTTLAGMSSDNDGASYSDFVNNTDSLTAFYPPQRHEGGTSVDADLNALQERLARLRAELSWDAQEAGPPNADFGPVEFVSAVLSALHNPDTPLPDFGFRALLRSSTRHWRDCIRSNVGAPEDADEHSIARALSNAMGRPNNLFGLLVGAADAEECEVSFPSDVLDFEDGTCWLQCNLCRCRGNDSKVLVSTNWQLKQREGDGAWLVDNIDFRDLRQEEQSDVRG